MTNRKLAYIVKDQKPLVLAADATVQHACRSMWERRTGSVLVVDSQQRLDGIFTGRDAVRLLAEGEDAAATLLGDAMTPNPMTVTPDSRAIDALRVMSNGDFRHVPVTDNGRIWGVVSRGDFKGMEFEEFDWARIDKTAGVTGIREVANIIQDQKPLVLATDRIVRDACRSMWQGKCGSVLVVDSPQRMKGIFTGRDAVRLLAEGEDAAATLLGDAMTPKPVTIAPDSSAIDALRAMSDGGFRHIPVIDNGRICGVVSRGDFTGVEIDRLEEEQHLWECIR